MFSITSSNSRYTKNSAFDRALNVIRTDLRKKHFLSYHYRCAPSIIKFSNDKFYSNCLKVMTKEPLYGLYSGGVHFIHVDGETKDKKNTEELYKIEELISELNKNGISNIGVLTPFTNQANLLRKNLYSKATVGTIHSFQGGQCDAVILSSVIAPGATETQVSFAQNSARLINVALTRAKNLFIVVGNEATILNSKGFLLDLVNYIKAINSDDESSLPAKMPILSNQLYNDWFRKQLLNPGEKRVFNILKNKIENKPIQVYPKIPVKDTLFINFNLKKELNSYYFMAHFDFVIYDKDSLIPICAVEYDGLHHIENEKSIENDVKKNTICEVVNFKLIRINSKDESKGWTEFDNFINEAYS